MTLVELQECWRKFKEKKDSYSRDRLIQHYSYLVKITAGRMISYLPPSLERDDLVSAGIMGLIKAVDQYDPSRQVKFETYAIALIRGAMLESLRQDDWVPRSVRERLKLLERAYQSLEIKLGRPATEEEVMEELKLEPPEFHKLLVEASRTSLLSLEDILIGSEGGDSMRMGDIISDDRMLPSLEAEIQERRRILAVAIDRLPERECNVIALYYHEGMTFKEIGKILSVSESRVYQLHTQALIRIRGYLKDDTDLFR